MLPHRQPITGCRHALAGLLALVLLVATLVAGASPSEAHTHSKSSGSHAVLSAASDMDSSGSTGSKASHEACHGLRCGCHGGTFPDLAPTVEPPVLLRAAHGPVPFELALTSRQDAPPLQPPRA